MGDSNQAQARICDACSKPMTYLGTLPQSRRKPALIVFRCYSCNAVASEPITEMA